MARTATRRQVKPAPTPATNLISKYGRVSKTQNHCADESMKKVLFVELPSSHKVRTTEIKTESSPNKDNLPPQVVTSSSRKRKTRSTEEESTDEDVRVTALLPGSLKRQRVSRDCWKDEPTPIKPELTLSTTTVSATKNTASSIADNHRKSRKSTVISHAKAEGREVNQRAGRSTKYNAPTERNTKEELTRKQLPVELLELLDMQRAILKTVSLQITHQGSGAPLDISSITPHVSRTWGKRRVTVDDIRRCIAIQDMKPAGREDEFLGSPFIVTDYGRGKLCLEMDASKASTHIDEEKLCKQFEENLHIMCSQRATDEMTDLDVCFESLSFDDLPKSDITIRHTIKQNPALVKGQRALNELKNGILKKQQEKEAKAQAAKAVTTKPDGTRMSIFDRLRAKEAANAQVQLPTAPELARKRALHRVGDIAAIISMLVASSNSTGQPVISFTMPVLQQKLKESLRVPMSMEEGVDTVRILANEIAPEWMKVASVGGKEHVVIQTRRKPYEAELVVRINRLSA
ncbi:hypothetical protein CCHL11_05431 [Colletotrichum chlorophyti]|uniref:DNA replication factor Cdt1 C-terminal domain-containing protein n=1 Tax=Colletotrichum chlorophyti TaxID=708187 RepID=A0A1Q8RNN7_9PEZI|nr:hypothetical protein CCHL11_05431 [Colletotrichum chlorophyti]